MGGFKSDLGKVFQGLEARFFRLRGVRDGEAHSVSFQWLDVADRFQQRGQRRGHVLIGESRHRFLKGETNHF